MNFSTIFNKNSLKGAEFPSQMFNFSCFSTSCRIFFTMTEFLDKPAEKSGKVLAAFLEGLPLVWTNVCYKIWKKTKKNFNWKVKGIGRWSDWYSKRAETITRYKNRTLKLTIVSNDLNGRSNQCWRPFSQSFSSLLPPFKSLFKSFIFISRLHW